MGQLTLRLDSLLKWDHKEWGGNYRFYSWINDRNHAKLVDEGDPVSTDKELNYGFGMNFDQALTDVFGIFGRFGWQRPDIAMANGSATLEWSWSAGGQATGKYWMREGDVIAFAIGQTFPSREYKDAGNPGAGEGHIELYYNCKINEYLHISPDFQII